MARWVWSAVVAVALLVGGGGPVRGQSMAVSVGLPDGRQGWATLDTASLQTGRVAVLVDGDTSLWKAAELRLLPAPAPAPAVAAGSVPTTAVSAVAAPASTLTWPLGEPTVSPPPASESSAGINLLGTIAAPVPEGQAMTPPVTVAGPPDTQGSGRSFRVKATAEGLIGAVTASGLLIRPYTEGVALPSRAGLGRVTQLTYLKNGARASCQVLDVGPWNTNDPYWDREGGRPQSESGRDLLGRRTNGSGIDLFNGTWYKLLGLRSYDRRLIESSAGPVEWKFAQ